ncbi:MAG: hypothetical protein ACLUHA_11535 [Bacteroides stercoris]
MRLWRESARRIGWVCECGARLDASLGGCSCGRSTKEENGNLLAVAVGGFFDRFRVPDSHTQNYLR